jgi:RNA polymerase sigma-70 factor (ECF subfamily)
MVRRASDSRALFEALVEPCRRVLWTFLLRLVGDRALAEDLYQETLLRAWKGLAGYHERGRFVSWLLRIAHNVVRDEARRRAARPTLVVPAELPEIAEDATAEHLVAAGEARHRVGDCVSQLTREQREVFLLRMHSDLDFKAIAELTGAPLSTVINRMRDALAKLSAAMEAR